MGDQGYSQMSTSARFWKSAPHSKASTTMDDKPTTRHAFDDLTTVTTAGHAKVTRILQERYLRLYEWSAWAIGMPKLEEVQSSKTAIVIMNAGGGMGLSLSLEFAEAGYTVFALVHQDLKASEDGSLGQLLLSWQKRRAAILSDRVQRGSLDTMSSPLGNVFPLPFRPLSLSSREKVRQTMLAYCSSQSLRLYAAILTPVFAMSSNVEGPLEGDSTRGSREHSFAPSPAIKISPSLSKAKHARDDPTEVDSSDELVSLKALLPLPSARDKERAKEPMSLPTREGSYVPSSTVDQAVLQRAAQREVAEQVVVAQMLADLLSSGDPAPSSEPSRKHGAPFARPRASSSPSKHARPPPFPRDRSMSSAAYLPRKPTDLTQKEGQDEDEDDDGDGQPRVPYGIADLLWYSMKKKLSRAIPKLPKFKRKQAEQRTKGDSGGKIVWVMGAGETSFMGTGSISGAMDAARESVALSLSSELGTLGVHVSTVTTGPLIQRTRHLGNILSSSEEDEAYPGHDDAQTRRARLLARISTLWAIDDKSCFWIVKQAVEAQYPKRTYTFGLDVLVRRYATLVPDGAWQLASWVVYERLGGSRCEAWLTKGASEQDPKQASPMWIISSKLLQLVPVQMAFGLLAQVAQRVRGD